MVVQLKEKVLAGEKVGRQEALSLADADLEELCGAADEIRRQFCGDAFDICAIVNAKSGKCSENCKFCAQAGCHDRKVENRPLLSEEALVRDGKDKYERGAHHYGIVTSGRRVSKAEVDSLCKAIRRLKEETRLSVCISLGIMDEEDFFRLKEAGAERVHNNLEASRAYFPKLCTTHSYDEKIAVIRAAKKAGLSVCSGGIMGVGESMEDRIDMAFTLRELEVDSVPVNMLNPIPDTPLFGQPVLGLQQMRRIVAVYRFILPDKEIRLAGGRLLMEGFGRDCLVSGANAFITGDMLTTKGITMEKDIEMIGTMGYRVS